MNKAVLVIDMPCDCNQCDLRGSIDHTCYAAIASTTTNKSNVDDYVLESEKPDWCPLKSLPEKLNSLGHPDPDARFVAMVYNACLDEITGDTE